VPTDLADLPSPDMEPDGEAFKDLKR